MLSNGQALAVQEIFPTLQGEGPDSGRPATFIRLWGCHLKCWFCDTDFESNGRQLNIENIAAVVKRETRLVVITGGEPMRQNIGPLVRLLITYGHDVQIETAGGFWWQEEGTADFYEPPLRPRWSFVVSPKTPAIHPAVAADARAFKYVLSAQQGIHPADGLPVVNYQERGGVARPLARPPSRWLTCRREDIFVQPMDEGDEAANARNRALCAQVAMEHGYRVSLQMHKLLNIP